MEFNALVDIFLRSINKFRAASDTVKFSAVAAPDWNRGSPITRSGDSPVFNLFQPISETLLTDEFRIPINSIIVCNELVLERAHLDIPALASVINKRSSAAPAVRIVMLYLLLCEHFCVEPFDYIDVESIFHYEATRPRSRRVFTAFVNRLENRESVFDAAVIVVFTKGRSRVNDTGTIFCGYIVHTRNKECLYVVTERLS